ncbi:hypothetical protein ACFE04_026731 [Oxalis oulophora]
MSSKGKNNNNGDEEKRGKIITDPRFAAAHTDPRFRNVRKRKTKVEIDSRFEHALSDPNFASSKAPTDKRGKPKKSKQHNQNSLQRYYELEKEDSKPIHDDDIVSRNESDSSSDEDEDEDEDVKEDKIELASESDSDSEMESSESGAEVDYSTDADEEEYEDDNEDAIEENVPQIEKETHRLAVVNLDWRYVKATDLYVTLSSFLPQNGQILSVSVYPSEFGLQRMKEEEVHGPVGLFDDDSQSDDEEDGDDEVDNEKLRQYELSKLKYYYAVVECDSSATADHLYKNCDGVEYERSANVLDLRFIPDSTEFKHPPRDVATEAPANYKALEFETRALQQSKVNLSWDEDEPDRVKTLNRKFTEDQLAELELKEFLASDESDTDEDGENVGEEQQDKKNKKQDMYRALLQSGDGSDEEDEEGGDMEVTFNTGLDGLSKRILEKKDKKSESVWEAYQQKRREKKKASKHRSKNSSDDDSSDSDQEPPEQPDDFFIEEPPVKKSKKVKNAKQAEDLDDEGEASRAELELLLADDKGEDDGPKGYKIKPKKAKKGKKGKEVPVESKIPAANFEDSRFSSLFTSPQFALDPTDPQFKRSAAYARQFTKRQHGQQELVERRPSKATKKAHFPSEQEPKINNKSEPETSPSKNEKYELSSLVRSIKAKSQQFPKSTETDEILLQPRDIKNKKKQRDVSPLGKSTKKKTKKMKS